MAGVKGGAPRGNQNACKAKPWREAIDRALKRDRAALDRVAKRLISSAEEGDMSAIQELGNRLDGKPQQNVDVTFSDAIAEQLRAARERLGKR